MRLSPRFRRSSRRNEEEENLSDAAAWLYTDLLLGLAVVFIGGGAFIQRFTGPSEKGSDVVEVQQPLTYQLSCDEIEVTMSQESSPVEVDEIVTRAIVKNSKLLGWTEAKAGVVQVFGIDPAISAANADARRFVERSVNDAPSLKSAEIQAYGNTSSELGRENVLIRIFVVYKGQVKDNGCKNN